MKKLLALTLLTLTMSLTSCAHHMGGCCKSDKQCEMKKEGCTDCKGKDSAQCAMKGHEEHKAEAAAEVKK